MDIALVFAPATDPRSPHLAIPSLTASLRASGHEVSNHDVDVQALHGLLSPESLAESERRCATRVRGGGPAAERARRALERAALVRTNGIEPLQILRSNEFYQPHRRQLAREGLECLLELHGAANGRVQYGVGPIRYAVEGIDPTKFTDLLTVTADPAADLFEEAFADLQVALRREQPLLAGVSILNQQQLLPSLRCARLLKQWGHRVVIGGTFFAKFVDRLQHLPEFFTTFADVVVPYEGEAALTDLLARARDDRELAGAVNTLALDAQGAVQTGPVSYEDVDRLSTPDFSSLPLDRYLTPEPVLPLLSGKGCYFNRCKFCDIPMINAIVGRNYRRRSPGRIVQDVVTLQSRHGARFFEFTDEALAPVYASQFCDAVETARVEASYVGYARLERRFDEGLFDRMHQAGFRKLFFGLESGSQRMVDHMDKQVSVAEAPRILADCAGAGISFHLFSMIGLPEETERDARETLSFFLDNRAVLDRPDHSFDVHPFTLDLRTDYYDNATDYGIDLDTSDLEGRDFPLSTEAWRNTRGLGFDEVGRLLADFETQLKPAFRQFRSFPVSLWPGFEEYAVLYAEHYGTGSFGYRYALPDARHDVPFRLEWAAGTDFQVNGQLLHARNLRGEFTIPLGLAAALGDARDFSCVDELVALLSTGMGIADQDLGPEQLTGAVDALLESGAIWLVPPLSASRHPVPA